MRCCIHRGCHEIGGNCVEVETDGRQIVLDIGLPLKNDSPVDVPDVRGLRTADASLGGVFITHPHPDHYGLLEQVSQRVPVFMGAAASRIVQAGAFFTPLPSLGAFKPQGLSHGEAVSAGPFQVTPFQIDHSAYDSYCLLVEADGKRLFYSGDLRAHGRRADLFEQLVTVPPTNIDVLICEGTQLGRNSDFVFPDEHAVADRMAEVFDGTPGMCLVWCSSQNIDRIVTVADAAQRTGRNLILDMYTAEILRAANDAALPQPGRDGVTVFLPQSQRNRIKRERAFDIPAPYRPHRIFWEDLKDAAPRSVMIFRPSMLNDLKRADCLSSATLVSSIWSGYLQRESQRLAEMKAMGIEHVHTHTSGHATVEELQRFIGAFPGARVVPIHLEDRDGFSALFPNVELQYDRQWWEV
ncbi:MAG: MBL fold metallo-hydrolase [Planctomycetaceae bacterium]|nr:MBL fold metallo-hydrolase [Planctomycetales bacterium]MCB9921019.1 MBL fold metallo-hydrolase [Planctomycetaceae bacterium]